MKKSRKESSHYSKSTQAQGRRGGRKPSKTSAVKDPMIWGIHAVAAALDNPHRDITSLMLTINAAHRIQEILARELPPFAEVSPRDIDKVTGPEPVHQGALLLTSELPQQALDDLSGQGCVVVLDQVTDPHNVGAILRSAAAFGVTHLIMTQRHSPPLFGTLAKTACGGLEHVKVILVGNLAQALVKLGKLGYERIGFDGMGDALMEDFQHSDGRGVVLILGAEEKGIRRLTKEHCDHICRIHAGGAFQSLNVSNAAAIAFHHFQDISRKHK